MDREGFEAFMRSLAFSKEDLRRNQYGHYKDWQMQAYWEVWQEAKKCL